MAGRPGTPARVQSTAQLQRDDAIQRAGLTRRIAVGGAAALTAGIAAFVSAVAPGKTFGAPHAAKTTVAVPASTAATRTSTPTMPALASASQLGLAAGSAPQAAPSQQQQVQPPPVQQAPVQQVPAPPVVSGGS